MSEFYVVLHYALGMLILFGGSVMLWSIPIAIAGRGNRSLFLFVLPATLFGWLCLGAAFSNALSVSMSLKSSALNEMRAAALVPFFFYVSMPIVACVAGHLFGRWRDRNTVQTLLKT